MKPVFFLLPLLAMVACAPQPQDDSGLILESLIQAERAFAATSVTEGTRDAFLGFLADDGILFNPGPVNGRSLWEGQAASGTVLSWYPEIADVSGAGDMGYTSGPWEIRLAPDSAAVGWGHFVSVWRRSDDGSWKVVADGGVSHERGPENTDSTVLRPWVGFRGFSGSENVDALAERLGLGEADERYSSAVADRGMVGSFGVSVAEEARFYREGALPILGRALAAESVLVTGVSWSNWESKGSVVSRSGDLGFTYGILGLEEEGGALGGPRPASYYRIWRKRTPSEWQVVVDVLIPFPAD